MNSGARLPRLRRVSAVARPSSRLSYSDSINHSASTTSSRRFPEDKYIKLPESRGTLCYATYGSPTGFPVLYLHGYPGSRLEPVLISHLAHRHDLFLIAPDRPSFGQSTAQPGRKIADYPRDLYQLTQHLGLRRYAVIGSSGGGPYAIACAHSKYGLPRDEVRAVGVLAGAPTWEAGIKDVTTDRRILGWMSRNMPNGLRIGADGVLWMTKWILTTAYVQRLIENWMKSLTPKTRDGAVSDVLEGENEADSGQSVGLDRLDVTPAKNREMLVAGMLEGFAQGSGGAVQEAKLLTEPWGFNFEDVDHESLFIWHGARDTNAPISMIRWMAKRLPRCHFQEFPDDSHYTIGHRLEQIFEEFVAAAKGADEPKDLNTLPE